MNLSDYTRLLQVITRLYLPYTVMYERPPPRAIAELINFPSNPDYQFDNIRFYSKVAEQVEKRKDKYRKAQPKIIKCYDLS